MHGASTVRFIVGWLPLPQDPHVIDTNPHFGSVSFLPFRSPHSSPIQPEPTNPPPRRPRPNATAVAAAAVRVASPRRWATPASAPARRAAADFSPPSTCGGPRSPPPPSRRPPPPPPTRRPSPSQSPPPSTPPHSSRSSDQPQTPSAEPQTQDNNPPAKRPVPKVKRVQSAGLLADSVLKRDVNTARLKDLYTIGKKLGQGQFGTTYLCVEKATGREFACKSIAKRKLLTEEDVEDVRREIQIMHHLAGSRQTSSPSSAPTRTRSPCSSSWSSAPAGNYSTGLSKGDITPRRPPRSWRG
ncbi:hypothetical protein PR202_gb10696 [Eleusine coracana subsp. coracana]|uniref:Protein kinase domain-containing protein n=1 Tax=Eleusine coracana subsp. coracana TaxID=191504 RepID=A0AAV5EIL5_ELECO|nr:hypothetical protein PR202_gb10696 [Eleusine coracana subsp. coracana]